MTSAKLVAIALSALSILSPLSALASEADLVGYLQPTLKYLGGAARVYYAATCVSEQKGVGFPMLKLQPPLRGTTGTAAVQQIFQNDPFVTVARDRSGMLRITIGSVSTAILQTRIPLLTVSFPPDQYNPLGAVTAIEHAPEIAAAEQKLDVRQPRGVVNVLESPPIEGAPHVPREMQNVTLDDALSVVARTFKGIVVYGACTQPDGKGLFQIRYYGS